jgi:tRNA threonylcarbamoyl adenosine modification protein YeaZ
MPSIDATYALALHTSSPDLGLAISNFSGDSREQVWNLGRDLSGQLLIKLAEFLQPQTWRDLAFLAVAIGPGGFTGTRIGVVAARTLAQQLEIPLFGISSLAAIAYQQNLTGTIAVQMPAQRGELHTAIYQRLAQSATPKEPDHLLTVIQSDTVLTPEAWQTNLTQHSVDHHIQAESAQGQYAMSVLDLAHQQWQKGQRPHWSETLPFYGQHPVEV